ncbi:3-deoxy-7-phosphoheptulonate synthase [Rubeoparvulum massiliense]|uniref:3-deoxy-7-phosphoheptulonate synthase n=1 Tax=Rubeoparvulum massiliense TaxID=1631346 RepID=UPI00065E38F1|nr:3-deoxy-7-phosphoheptulonate synthase [Rubeoparvulum massiliense]
MNVILKPHTTLEEIKWVEGRLRELGVDVHVSVGKERAILGLVGETACLDDKKIAAWPHVERVIRIQEPFKRVHRLSHPEDRIIQVGDQQIGGKNITIMAGPCSVESHDQLFTIAKHVKQHGAHLLRGGAYKPRTSPYSFSGLKEEGLQLLAEAREEVGLPVVTEVTTPELVPIVSQYADVLQIGARNMQNYGLLQAVGKVDKPVLLKRGLSATIEELLLAAEYIVAEGNEKVILCERGIRTFETATRNTLDLSAVPVIKRYTSLPVIIDPSHAAGKRDLVIPLVRAAIAVGADGIIVEVHHHPEEAWSDGAQSLTLPMFDQMMEEAERVAQAVGRTLHATSMVR